MSFASLPEMKLRLVAILPVAQNISVRMQPLWSVVVTPLQTWSFLSRPTIGRAPPLDILLLQA